MTLTDAEKTAVRKGICPACGREITLTKKNLIRQHGAKDKTVWPPRNCDGWGKAPAETE